MLFPPVYYKSSKPPMQETLIPMGPPSRVRKISQQPPQPPNPPPPAPPTQSSASTSSNNRNTEENQHFPILCCTGGVSIVYPKEATRDVLSGRVAYYLADETGMTLFKPKHLFAALKLDEEHKHRFEDYGCIGAHQRFLPRKPPKREGLGYRRRYLSPELVGRGIYVSY